MRSPVFRVRAVLCVLLLLVAADFVQTINAKTKDLYQLLGVETSATEHEIKRQYRRLSRKYHPDMNGNDKEATDVFVEMTDAAEILTDKKLRRVYDRYGLEGVQRHRQGGSAGGSHSGGFDIFDLFAGKFGRQEEPEEPRGPDVKMDLVVTLEDIYAGKNIEVLVSNQQLCPHCSGSGAASPKHVHQCTACRGTGVRVINHMIAPGMYTRVQQTCDVCGGSGHSIKKKCPRCHGDGIVQGHKVVDVVIEPGIPENHEIVLENQADESPNDEAAGHIIFKVVTAPHKSMRRSGRDLSIDVDVDLIDALTGFSSTLTHLDKSTVEFGRTGITSPSQIIRLKGKGMPHHQYPSRAGDLNVIVNVRFPPTLTEAQKKVVAEVL